MNKKQIKSIILKESHTFLFFGIPILGPHIELADKVYDQCNIDQIKHELSLYTPPPQIIVPDRNDCDDATFRTLGKLAAWALLGFLKDNIRGALGFAWSRNHSFVIFIANGALWLIEPFSKPIVKGILTFQEASKDALKRYYPLRLVVI